jgi:CoA:oxalate CoA-transferase
MPDAPLAGITVVELATGPAVGLAARTMAGYGADVIKIEPPEGDPSRGLGPFPSGRADPETSAAFLYLHGGKSSVVLDLDTAAARDELAKLVAAADFLLTDTPLAQREGLGIGEAQLAEAAPRLTVVSVTPYGETGPHAGYLATDLTAAAAGGQMSLMGEADRPPLKAYGNQAELQASFSVFGAAMTAILRRNKTGKGSYVELSIQELQASAMEAQGPMAYNYDPPLLPGMPMRFGNSMRSIWAFYQCKDGYAGIFVNAPNYAAFFATIGHPELADQIHSNDFVSGPLFKIVTDWCAERTRQEIYEAAIAGGAPFSYVATPQDLLTSPIVEQTGIWRDVDHPVAGTFRVPGPPFRNPDAPYELRRAPLLGEHTADVLGHAGDGTAEVDAVVGQAAAARSNSAV